MGEIDLSLKVTGHALVVGKFPTEMPPFFGHLPVRFSSFHVVQNTPFPA